MISLNTKYLIQKVCWGVLFLWFGLDDIIGSIINNAIKINTTLGMILNIVGKLIIIVCILAYIITWFKKSEVEDELARKHNDQAQSLVYLLLMLVGLAYGLIGIGFMHLNVSLDINIIEIIFGLSQILVYILFLHLEKKGDFHG